MSRAALPLPMHVLAAFLAGIVGAGVWWLVRGTPEATSESISAPSAEADGAALGASAEEDGGPDARAELDEEADAGGGAPGFSAAPPEAAPRTDAGPFQPSEGAEVPLQGDAYVEQPDGTIALAARGSFRLDVVSGSREHTITVPVENGTFRVTVPERSRLRVGDGELEGARVRFSKPAGPFEPGPDRLALIGIPVPDVRVHVTAAGTGAELRGVSVRIADAPGGGRLAGERRAEPLVAGAASPIQLPFVPSDHPVWLEAEAEGYAPARLLVDPKRAGTHRFELHPAAGKLAIALRGPGRATVEVLVVYRVEGERRTVAAHLALTPPPAPVPDPWTLELEGLAAVPHLVRAARLDRLTSAGALFDLATANVALDPGSPARVELFVTNP